MMPPKAGEVRVKVVSNACKYCTVLSLDSLITNKVHLFADDKPFPLFPLEQCVIPISTLSMGTIPKDYSLAFSDTRPGASWSPSDPV